MLLEIQAAGRGRRNLQPIAEDFMDCVCFMKLSVLKPRKLTCHTQSQIL